MVSEIIQKRMLAASQNGAGIKYSDDFGSTFEDTNVNTGSFDTPIHTHNGVWLVRALGDGAEGIWRSIDGISWTQVLNSGLYKKIVILSDGAILVSSAISGKKSKASVDDGATWRDVSELEERTITSYFKDKFDSNIDSSGDGRNLMHILRCSSIPELAAKLRKMGNNEDYYGLREGDYFDLPSFIFDGQTIVYNAQYQNLRMEICGLGIYKNIYEGYTNNGPGILFQCKNIPFKHRMEANSINTNNKFSATELGGKLKNAVNNFEITLGLELREVKRYYSGNYASGVGDTMKLFLPTEIEVFGKNWWTAKGLQNYNMEFMWPIFAKNPQKRIKKYNGSQYWWWECNPAADSGYFCGVDTNGRAYYINANITDIGVPFAFYL